MTGSKPVLKILLTLALTIISMFSVAEEQSIEDLINLSTKKSDRSYVSFGYVLNEFRSIEMILVSDVRFDSSGTLLENFQTSLFPITAQTYAASATFGTYLTDHIKTEFRYGTGVRDDTAVEAMDININFSLSWYIGPTYPLTDYMSVYSMFGVTHYDADITRKERTLKLEAAFGRPAATIKVQPSRLQMNDDLFGTSFSTSWLLGLDFGLGGPWFLAFEYGRLLRDDDTGIRVYQGGTHLRYEF